MVEIIDVVDVGSNFWGEEFRIHRRFFCPGVASQPGEVRERKGFRCQRFRRARLPFSRACGLTEARAFSAGMTFAMASVVGAGGTPAALAATLDAVGLNERAVENGAAVASGGECSWFRVPRRAFSSCSTRSSSHRSAPSTERVLHLGALLFAGADFEADCSNLCHRPAKRFGTLLAQASARSTGKFSTMMNARILVLGI